MFGLGMGELLVIFIVALIVLGPTKLPKLAQDLGKAIREFRKATDDIKQELTADEELRRPFQELHEAVMLPPEELKRREEERRRLAEGGAGAGKDPQAPSAREVEADERARAEAAAVIARATGTVPRSAGPAGPAEPSAAGVPAPGGASGGKNDGSRS